MNGIPNWLVPFINQPTLDDVRRDYEKWLRDRPEAVEKVKRDE